jgi:hypothetical protein
MSASDEWTQWHLTPRGWEKGDSETDFNSFDKPTPDDRVQTVEYRELVASSFSGLEVTNEVIWSNEDEAAIVALTRKFGEAPNHL